MRLLLSLHLYLPDHAAGGEMYCHNIAKYMVKAGHSVRVLLLEHAHYNITAPYVYEGVEVFPATGDISHHFWWSDAVITHLGHTVWSAQLAKVFNKTTFFISHNTHPYDIVIDSNRWPTELHPKKAMRVIYNSIAMADILKYENNSIVVHPAIDRKAFDFGGPTGEYITLINVNANKGGNIFKAIARAMPNKKFLGIGGSYDSQIREDIPNLTYWPNSPDMEKVYRATRILLVPSAYESWGMCATEAMCNGIPVIYHPTFGLRENVGEYGISLPNKNHDYQDIEALQGGEHPGIDPEANLESWVNAIKKLDNHLAYKKYSNLSRERSLQFNPDQELKELENFLEREISDN